MRLSVILNLYTLKLKVFLGAFRASKSSIILLLVYVLGFLPSTIGLSSAIASALRQGGADAVLYVDILAAAVSCLMAAAILLSLRGVVVFEYEQSVVFTSPLRPSEFLVAGLLVNLTYLLIFMSPLFALYASLVFMLGLAPFQTAIILTSSLIFAISLIFLKTFLSLVKALHGRAWVNALMLAIAFILMLPTVGIFAPSLLRYYALPYPSTLFARIIINTILYGWLHPTDVSGFILFFMASLALFALASERNFFPFATQIPLVSPFDVSARTQAFKIESNIKFFSRMSIPACLNLESRSLLGFLIKKEIIRLTREGSAFSIILIYIIISVVFIAIGIKSPAGAGPNPSILLTIFSSYSIIVPVMLAGNWRIMEVKNLWLPISSGADLHLIVKATLYGFIIVALAIPLAIILLASILLRVNPATALVILIPASFIGCSVNLYLAVKFLRGGRRGTPSFLVGWLSILLVMLLLSPAYALIALPHILGENAVLDAATLLGSLIYSIAVMRAFLKLTESNMRFVEV